MTVIVSKQRPGVGRCDNCGGETVRVIGWSIATDTGQGWQGNGTVRLCQFCLQTEADALGAVPMFNEEIKARLAERGIAAPTKATRDDLLALYSDVPQNAGADSNTVAAAPAGGAGARSVVAGPAPTMAALQRMSRVELIAMAEAEPYVIVGVPPDATKVEIANRIIAAHG